MIQGRAEKALFLIAEGYTAKEIVEACWYANISCVFNLANSHGLKVAKANSKLHDAMRRYKAEGHTMGEVAEKFCVTQATAQTICKGIAPQKPRSYGRKVKPHQCIECGLITENPKYCCEDCRRRALYRTQNVRRRTKVQNAMVDTDITLHGLFVKNKGRCHICGGVCDFGDHRYKNGRFVCGNSYPTIDHVIPLAKGGEHSWANVKLAHHSCNSAKGASFDE